jgi:hypothetical protein
MCYQLSILGGFCGDCLSDADCPDGGCTLPNPLSDPPGGATCNMGELGGGCEARSTDVCQEGLTCELLLDVPDLFQINTCSECSADADCGELLCSPSVDLLAFSGQKTCVSPGDVVDGQACDHEGSGDEACASGICAAYNVMGLVTIGVCGECEIDGDCPNPGDVCNDPSVDLETGVITPTFCSAPE